jgi:hypothetical protein
MFKNSKSLLRSKAGNHDSFQFIEFSLFNIIYYILGKSKGTIIDVPGKSLEPTPVTIVQPSNSQESGGSNKTAQSETNPDAIIVNYEGNTIDVVSQAPQDIMMDASPSILPAKTRSSEKRSTTNRTANNDNMMNKSSGDGIQKKSLQKFPTSPKIILSFTNDSLVESSSSSVTGTVESQNARQDSEDAISQHIEESDVTTEDSSVKTRQRKTAITNKKRARSNNDDEQSEDSTIATSSSSKQSKQSKRRKRSSSVASITSSTNTDGSSTKSNSTAGRKRRSKSRKARTTTRKQQSSKSRVKPWEDDPEDENPLDDSIVTMAELCKDLKRGRKSNTFKELEYAKYQKSQQKRRQRAAANNIRDDDQMNVGDGETPIPQHLGDELVQDQNIPGDHQNEQNEQYEIEQNEQNEEFNNDGSENYEEYYENREWEQEGYYDDDGNWVQYENYENEEYQQDYEMEEVEEENTQQDENNENHKPTLMKRYVDIYIFLKRSLL